MFLSMVWGIVLLVDTGLSEHNLAHNKTAYQSSVALGGIASRAVDGRRESNFNLKSCVHTKESNRPWWAVDLAFQYQLDSVTLVNRGDCCADSLSDFIIGTTDVNPNVTAPTETNVRVCHRQGEALGLGEVRSFKCEEKGRYVVVLRTKNRVYLTLCEVEVYGKSEGSDIIRLDIPNTLIIATILEKVKLPISFSLASASPWKLEWYIEDKNQMKTLIYVYEEGLLESYMGPMYLRVERDNVSLIVQETIDTISERRFCCKVSLPGVVQRHAEGCMTVTYIAFPANALVCTDLLTRKPLKNNDVVYYEKSNSRLVFIRCRYTQVHPACAIEASYKNEADQYITFARAVRYQAGRTEIEDERGTSVHYDHNLEFERYFENELTLIVSALGENVERTIVLTFLLEVPDESPIVDINHQITNPFISAQQGSKVKLQCPFSLTSDLRWLLEWYTQLPSNPDKTIIYKYSPGVLDEPTDSEIFRVESENGSLSVQETIEKISERRFCCKVSVPRPFPSRTLVQAEGCINVTYTNFPDENFDCINIGNVPPLTSKPVYQDSPFVKVICLYSDVHPAFDIEVYNGSETGVRIAFASREDASSSRYENQYGMETRYHHTLEITIDLIDEVMLHVIARADNIERRKLLHFIRRVPGIDGKVMRDMKPYLDVVDVVQDKTAGEQFEGGKTKSVIIGGTVGAVFLVIIITTMIVMYRKKKYRKDNEKLEGGACVSK